MHIKHKFLFRVICLWMAFFLSDYAMAAFTFTALDTQGKLLSFANPALIAGTCPTGKTCVANGNGTTYAGAKYKYTNVITIGTVRVDAIVSVDSIVNATLTTFDDATPNPTGSSRAKNGAYTTSFGWIVPEAAIFAPQITNISHTLEGYVKFTISFVDSTGNPVVLQNVYNNSLDMESVEYNAYGGFSSYKLAGDNVTNPKHVIATAGLAGNMRFSSSDCTGDPGLYIKDQSRVQTKFNTITSLQLTLGQFANNAVPNGSGGYSTCSNSSIRYYGAIFVQDGFIDNGKTDIEITAPTVDLLTTSNTKPTITGTLGGVVSVASPNGSALATGETFSIIVNGVTYTNTNTNLTMSGANWSLNIPTALPIGTYDVSTARTGGLVDQTTNELVITPACVSPQILDTTGTTCTTPSTSKIPLCHSGNGKNYAKILIPLSGLNGHETHQFDLPEDVDGRCPDNPVICHLPQILNPDGSNTCYTPPAQCTTVVPITSANSSSNTIPSSVQVTTTSTGSSGGNWWNNWISRISTSYLYICHATSTGSNPYPYKLMKISKTLVYPHAADGDYYPLYGVCPTASVPCPGTVCRLPGIINPANGQCVIPPDPSVIPLTTGDTTPVITGYVGAFQLGVGENFRVKINGVNYYYNYKTTANSPELQLINDSQWILTIPSSTPLSIGTTYDVRVDQDDINADGTDNYTDDATDETDLTTNEVVISSAPTVISQVTTNTTPTIKGTVGNVALSSGETFTVQVNNKIYSTVDTTPNLTVSGINWTLIIPSSDVLSAGTAYNVFAIRDQSLMDSTINELIIPDAPTVDSQTTISKTPIITGTAGTALLDASETFTVLVNGKTYARTSLTFTDSTTTGTTTDDKLAYSTTVTSWSLQIPTANAIPASATPYNVTATRSGIADTTSGELTIGCLANQGLNAAGTACVDMWNGLAVSDILALNATWNTESYLNASCQNNITTNYSSTGIVNTEWASCPRSSGVFKSHIQTDNNINYHCHFEVTGSGISGTYVKEAQFDVAASLTTAQKWALINSSCGATSTPVPTVNSLTTSNTTPSITGTVGTTGLSASEAFSVTVNGTTYSKGNAALIIGTTDWTLNIPTVLTVGSYNVDVLRNGNTPDTTSGELVIIGTNPTVTPLSTNNPTPTIMGTFGTNNLTATEIFTVTVNGVTYTKGDGNLVTLSSSWSLTIPAANALKNGTYEVDAVRNNTLHDLTANELTIAIAVPTVTKQTLREKLPVVIKGTVGDVALGTSETFTVAVAGKTYTKGTDASLSITALAWTLTIPTTTTIAVGTYDVVATRAGTLVDTTTGELIITALSPPTVVPQTTFKTTPVITGTVGDVILDAGEIFTVTVNGVTYTAGDTHLVVSTLAWTLTIPVGSEIAGRVQPYEVVAARGTLTDTTTLELTIQPCALPKVVNAAGDQCITPTPTVNSQTVNTNLTVTPTLTGTVGEVALGSTETFTVTIPTTTPQTYTYKTDSALTISGLNWTLIVPAAKAIPVGTYDIVAARNTSAKDITKGELVVNLVCLTGETNVNGICVSTSSLPTVDTLSTDSSTPVITGTIGGSVLAVSESFTVEINGKIYSNGDGNLMVTGKTWALTIPIANALPSNTYPVLATRNSLTGTGTVIITACLSPKSINSTTGDCSLPNVIPTVNQTNADINASTIVVTGTVGDTVLGNDTFSVKVHNSAHPSDITCAVVVSGTNWMCTLSNRFAGTFDVDAVRNSNADTTSGELVITDNIVICDNGTDKSITKSAWDGSKEGTTYYIGTCKPTSSSATLPISPSAKNESLPNSPLALVNQFATVPLPPEIVYCDDGGVKSDSSATNVTIKRATIVNASTQGGTVDLMTMPTKIKYGLKTPSIGSMDITAATITQGNRTTGAILRGVTIDDVYIDILTDFIDTNGNPIDGGSTYIKVTGGTTKPTTTKEDKTITIATITSGVITSGQDANGNPVRGAVTSSHYDNDIVNADSVITQGRRTRGKLVNATIESASTVTVEGVTVVDSGMVTGGTLETGSTSPVSTFGTVTNATLTGATISNSNHCFSSGKVGSKGQLNWKEVIKN